MGNHGRLQENSLTCAYVRGWGKERKMVKQQPKKSFSFSFFHEVLICNSGQWGQMWPQTKAFSLERTDQYMVNTQATFRHTQFRIPTLPPRWQVILKHCLLTLIVFKMQTMIVCLLKLMRELNEIIHVKYLSYSQSSVHVRWSHTSHTPGCSPSP